MRRGAIPVAVLTLLVFFALAPILTLTSRALGSDLIAVWTGAPAREALANTLLVASGAGAIALLFGAPLAVALYRTDLPGRDAFASLFSSVLAVPPFVWCIGWIGLANPTTGFFNRLGLVNFNIYGTGGIAFVLGTAGLPLVLLAGGAALRRVDPTLEEAARMCGAGPLKAFAQATLPLLWPSLLSGAVLVFLLGASAFGVPYLLGTSATPPTRTITTRIYERVLLGGDDNLAAALALSIVLLVAASVVLVANQWLGSAGRVTILSGKGARARPMSLGPWRWWVFFAVLLFAVAVVLVPLGAILLSSLQSSAGADTVIESLSLVHWQSVVFAERTLAAAGRSFYLALDAAVIVAGFGVGVALSRRVPFVGKPIEFMAQWPYAIPGTVLAMGFIVFFSMNYRFVFLGEVAVTLLLASTTWLLLIAYAVKYLALGARNVIEGFEQLDPSLAESARIFGAGPVRAFRDAVFPALLPSIATAFVLTFMLSATELTMSVLLVPPGGEVLGTLLFELQTYADPGAGSALAFAFVILVLAGFAGVAALRSRGEAHG